MVGGAKAIGMPAAGFNARVKKKEERYKEVVQGIGIPTQ